MACLWHVWILHLHFQLLRANICDSIYGGDSPWVNGATCVKRQLCLAALERIWADTTKRSDFHNTLAEKCKITEKLDETKKQGSENLVQI